MFHSAGDRPLLCIQTNQTSDTFTRTMLSDSVSARLLSVRCQEAQTQSLLNQDFAQVLYQQENSSLCFCVCDGVGSSYKGDFAAYYLATHLIAWLQTLTELLLDPDVLATVLRDQLNAWTDEAQLQLKQQAIPADTPVLVREVLEELRDTYGSETVFLCGRLDYANWSTHLQQSRPIQALFCWMGNVTARLSIVADQSIMLGDQDDKAGRWSTVRGSRGPINSWSVGLTTIDRLIVHTDGLNAIEQSLGDLDDTGWQSHVRQLLQHPSNDDMTALDLQWIHEDAPTEGV